MRVVVDTNIIFSGILTKDNKIGELLIKSKDNFEFFSPDQLKWELEVHKEKLIKIANYSESEYNEAKELALAKVKIIKDSLIPKPDIGKAAELLKDIDLDDTVFLALAIHFNSKLWTGDMQLIQGLNQKGFYNTITTEELYKIFLDYEGLKE